MRYNNIVKWENPRDKSAAYLVATGRRQKGGETMKTLRKHGGTWYANGRPYKALHDAVKALRS